MKRLSTFLLILLMFLFAATGMAQNSTTMGQSPNRAAVEGIVTKDPDSQPVRKALIELIAENQAEGGNYTAVSGGDGAFRIENVAPGRYRLFAERVGLLDVGKNHTRNEGRVLVLTAGQEVKDLRIRLLAGAVVRGRVTDEDGDPMNDAEVTVLRQTFASGHTHWEQAGAERTNDLGEYRVANLPPGNVYVSVNPPPNFESLIETAGVAGAPRKAEKPATAYQTTYYPGTTDRGQASPIQIHAGDDFPVNFSLIAGPSLSIRGSVLNLPPRASATITLQSRDFSVAQSGTEIHKDGSFVIRDVSPGNYTILAAVDGSPVPMTARQSLTVSSSNVEGLRLTPQPGAIVRGHMRLESRSGASRFDPAQIFLSLQTANPDDEGGAITVGDRFTNLAHVSGDGSFEWKDVPPGNYYVQLLGETGAQEDWFVKSVAAGGREVNDAGLGINGGGVGLDLVMGANGGIADGIVIDSKGTPVESAVVVAVPEPRMRGRLDRYQKTVSDQSGHFSMHGIRPGDYTVFAWESVDAEAYFNPEFLKRYEDEGAALHVAEGERKTLRMNVIPAPEDQQ